MTETEEAETGQAKNAIDGRRYPPGTLYEHLAYILRAVNPDFSDQTIEEIRDKLETADPVFIKSLKDDLDEDFHISPEIRRETIRALAILLNKKPEYDERLKKKKEYLNAMSEEQYQAWRAQREKRLGKEFSDKAAPKGNKFTLVFEDPPELNRDEEGKNLYRDNISITLPRIKKEIDLRGKVIPRLNSNPFLLFNQWTTPVSSYDIDCRGIVEPIIAAVDEAWAGNNDTILAAKLGKDDTDQLTEEEKNRNLPIMEGVQRFHLEILQAYDRKAAPSKIAAIMNTFSQKYKESLYQFMANMDAMLEHIDKYPAKQNPAFKNTSTLYYDLTEKQKNSLKHYLYDMRNMALDLAQGDESNTFRQIKEKLDHMDRSDMDTRDIRASVSGLSKAQYINYMAYCRHEDRIPVPSEPPKSPEEELKHPFGKQQLGRTPLFMKDHLYWQLRVGSYNMNPRQPQDMETLPWSEWLEEQNAEKAFEDLMEYMLARDENGNSVNDFSKKGPPENLAAQLIYFYKKGLPQLGLLALHIAKRARQPWDLGLSSYPNASELNNFLQAQFKSKGFDTDEPGIQRFLTDVYEVVDRDVGGGRDPLIYHRLTNNRRTQAEAEFRAYIPAVLGMLFKDREPLGPFPKTRMFFSYITGLGEAKYALLSRPALIDQSGRYKKTPLKKFIGHFTGAAKVEIPKTGGPWYRRHKNYDGTTIHYKNENESNFAPVRRALIRTGLPLAMLAAPLALPFSFPLWAVAAPMFLHDARPLPIPSKAIVTLPLRALNMAAMGLKVLGMGMHLAYNHYMGKEINFDEEKNNRVTLNPLSWVNIPGKAFEKLDDFFDGREKKREEKAKRKAYKRRQKEILRYRKRYGPRDSSNKDNNFFSGMFKNMGAVMAGAGMTATAAATPADEAAKKTGTAQNTPGTDQVTQAKPRATFNHETGKWQYKDAKDTPGGYSANDPGETPENGAPEGPRADDTARPAGKPAAAGPETEQPQPDVQTGDNVNNGDDEKPRRRQTDKGKHDFDQATNNAPEPEQPENDSYPENDGPTANNGDNVNNGQPVSDNERANRERNRPDRKGGDGNGPDNNGGPA